MCPRTAELPADLEAVDGRRFQRDGVRCGDDPHVVMFSRIVCSWSRARAHAGDALSGASIQASSSAPSRWATTNLTPLADEDGFGGDIHMATAWAKWACTGTVIAIKSVFPCHVRAEQLGGGPRGTGAGRVHPPSFNDRFRRDVVANSFSTFPRCRAASWSAKTRTTTDGGRGPREVSPAERQTFVRPLLPDLAGRRRGLVVRAMAVEGLTVPRIAPRRSSRAATRRPTTLELGSRGVGSRAMTGAATAAMPAFLHKAGRRISPSSSPPAPGRSAAPVVYGSPAPGSARRRRAGRGPVRGAHVRQGAEHVLPDVFERRRRTPRKCKLLGALPR